MSTIAAIATPPGSGGIGIVRLSGPLAKELLAQIFLPLSPHFENFRPWLMHRGRVLDQSGEALDDVLAVFMPGPRTFTGEDMAEIQCHGGPLIVQAVLESVLRMGAEQAGPGEFSRRAFVNGRMDLSQAEAVAELINAPSREALRYSLNRLDGLLGKRVLALRDELERLRVQMSLAVDFPDDEVECLEPEQFRQAVAGVARAVEHLLEGQKRARVMQQGALVVLAGAVNAGKSSLLNALLGRNRALVTDIPGTTRDFLEEACDLNGLLVRLTDTAGLRRLQVEQGAAADLESRQARLCGSEQVEALGMARSREKMEQADCIVLVLDGAALGQDGAAAEHCPDAATQQVLELAEHTPLVLVWNKCDICRPEVFPPRWVARIPSCAACMISAREGENIDTLAQLLRQTLLADGCQQAPVDGLAPNARQSMLLENALAELQALQEDLAAGQPCDCCAVRLDTAAAHLGEVTGLSSPAEVLDRVFSQFCIGK